jgi:hypothetical protein
MSNLCSAKIYILGWIQSHEIGVVHVDVYFSTLGKFEIVLLSTNFKLQLVRHRKSTPTVLDSSKRKTENSPQLFACLQL